MGGFQMMSFNRFLMIWQLKEVFNTESENMSALFAFLCVNTDRLIPCTALIEIQTLIFRSKSGELNEMSIVIDEDDDLMIVDNNIQTVYTDDKKENYRKLPS